MCTDTVFMTKQLHQETEMYVLDLHALGKAIDIPSTMKPHVGHSPKYFIVQAEKVTEAPRNPPRWYHSQ